MGLKYVHTVRAFVIIVFSQERVFGFNSETPGVESEDWNTEETQDSTQAQASFTFCTRKSCTFYILVTNRMIPDRNGGLTSNVQ